MIVMKFGGTSMGSAHTIGNCVVPLVAKAHSQGRNPLVVVSAMAGVTNRLLAASQAAVDGDVQEVASIIQAIQESHLETLKKLTHEEHSHRPGERIVDELFRLRVFLEAIAVVRELSCRSKDIVLAVGEKLSAIILAAALTKSGLQATYLPLDAVIERRKEADPEQYWLHVQACFRSALESAAPGIPVLTGFFGPTRNGIMQAVGRGYSDFCAALVGAAVQADVVEIWTDVDGVLSTNPKVVPEAFLLQTIGFDEIAELAHFGAKVLHPHSVAPALRSGVPLRILNTFNPHGPGTAVVRTSVNSAAPFKSISYKKSVAIIRLATPLMLFAHGYIAKVGAVFAAHQVSIDLVATSEVSVSLSVEQPLNQLADLLADLRPFGEVHALEGQSIICLVGTELDNSHDVLARVFHSLHEEGIQVRMLSMGDLRINLSLVVDDQQCERTVRLLHQEFFPNPA